MHDFDDLGTTGNVVYFEEANNIIMGAGGAIYTLLMKIGFYGILLSVLVCAIAFIVSSGDTTKRPELKKWVMRIGVVTFILSGFTELIGLIGALLTVVE